MKMAKLLTIDITNTVIRVLGGVGQQYASIAAIYGLKADADKLNVAFQTNWKEHNLNNPNFGLLKGMTAHVWWNELVKQCFISSGYSDSEKLSRIATHLYLHFTTANAWEVLPDANKVLQLVKSKGLTIGVVSNFDKRLEKVLSSVGLLHNFDFVLGSQLVGHAKPDPMIFQKALDLAGVCASKAVHVGDNVENDYLGSRSVGISGLLLSNDVHKVPSYVDRKHIITNLSEVLKFV